MCWMMQPFWYVVSRILSYTRRAKMFVLFITLTIGSFELRRFAVGGCRRRCIVGEKQCMLVRCCVRLVSTWTHAATTSPKRKHVASLKTRGIKPSTAVWCSCSSSAVSDCKRLNPTPLRQSINFIGWNESHMTKTLFISWHVYGWTDVFIRLGDQLFAVSSYRRCFKASDEVVTFIMNEMNIICLKQAYMCQ